MRTIFYAAALVMSLGSAACVGGIEPMPPSTGDDDPVDPEPEPDSVARQQYEADVEPLLASACQSCHVGALDAPTDLSYNFLGPTPGDFYVALTADSAIIGGFNPDLATLITKGEHDGGAARAWTDAEKATITEWLITEAEERDVPLDDGTDTPPGGTATPTTSREALAQWAGCMSIDDWLQSQVFQWANKGSDRGQCESCHNQGAGGFFANDDENLMFEMNRYEIYITTFFTARPKNIANPSEGYEVVLNEQKLRAKANTVGHPAYNPDGGNQMQYLRDFYDLTMARMAAGTCGPAGFPTTPPAP